MPGGFEAREPLTQREGIPVDAGGDPGEPAYVVARDHRQFEVFCANSGVNKDSPRVKFVPAQSRETAAAGFRWSAIEADDSSWKWVVFVGVDPSATDVPGPDWFGPDWRALERRRIGRQFTRAWHYDHLWIAPSVTQPSEDEMFARWDNDL